MLKCPSCGEEMLATKEKHEKGKVTLMLKCEKCWFIKYIELKTTEHFFSENKLRLIKKSD